MGSWCWVGCRRKILRGGLLVVDGITNRMWQPAGEILYNYASGHGVSMCRGMGVPAQMLLNGTVYLVCNPNGGGSGDMLATNLGLGLGLGLGIPAFIGLMYWWLRYSCSCACCRRERRHSAATSVSALLVVGKSPREAVEEVLSPEAFRDFQHDNLTESLKEELMIHRCREGRDLREFVRYADQCRAIEVAGWVDKLYPGLIPREIQQRAAAPRASAPQVAVRPAAALEEV